MIDDSEKIVPEEQGGDGGEDPPVDEATNLEVTYSDLTINGRFDEVSLYKGFFTFDRVR